MVAATPYKIIIADDHAIVREGLRTILQSAGYQIVAQASHGGEVLTLLQQQTCDLLVLDLSLPRINGFEVLRRVREQWPSVKVLVLSMYPAAQYASRVLQAGAKGYVSKHAPPPELLSIVAKVLSAETDTDHAATEQTNAQNPQRERAPHESLSAKEYQVFVLLVQGRAPGDIAVEMQLTPSAVSNHLARVRKKLDAQSNSEILQYAIRERFITNTDV